MTKKTAVPAPAQVRLSGDVGKFLDSAKGAYDKATAVQEAAKGRLNELVGVTLAAEKVDMQGAQSIKVDRDDKGWYYVLEPKPSE